MDSKVLEMLRGNYEEALSEIARKQDFSSRDLEHATKLLCAIEKIKTLEEDAGYSGRSMRSNRSYDGEGSSSRSYDERSYRSYDGGYSGHSSQDRMLKKLKGMLGEAESEQERQMVQEWIHRLEK